MPPGDSDSLKTPPLFAAGSLNASPKAMKSIPAADVIAALARHLNGNWGNVSPDDWKANDRAVVDGGRLLSVYHTDQGKAFWVLTEADRSSTTVLLPEEY